MACDPSEDSDISSLSCLDQCFRVDICKSFFLAFCELWFVYDFSWWHSLYLRAELCVLILQETSGIFAVGGRLYSVQLVGILL